MGNFYMEATQINYRRDDKPKTVDQKLQELSETSAIDTDIAPVFKSTNTYQPGDMVYYCNKLYVFNVEHTGTWAAADVTETDVTTEISSLKSGLTKQDVSNEFTVDTTYIDNFKAYKTNNIVYLSFRIKAQIADNTDLITPASDVAIDTYLYCMSSIYKSDGSLFIDGAIWIDKGFTVLKYYGSASSPNTGYVSMSYVTA